MRRKRVFEAVWPFFRFFILFGLCFVILYPLIYMISCAFRDPTDMSDPTVMWIPRHLTWSVIKDTANVMDIWNTLKTTLLLNVGCSLVQWHPAHWQAMASPGSSSRERAFSSASLS